MLFLTLWVTHQTLRDALVGPCYELHVVRMRGVRMFCVYLAFAWPSTQQTARRLLLPPPPTHASHAKP